MNGAICIHNKFDIFFLLQHTEPYIHSDTQTHIDDNWIVFNFYTHLNSPTVCQIRWHSVPVGLVVRHGTLFTRSIRFGHQDDFFSFFFFWYLNYRYVWHKLSRFVPGRLFCDCQANSIEVYLDMSCISSYLPFNVFYDWFPFVALSLSPLRSVRHSHSPTFHWLHWPFFSHQLQQTHKLVNFRTLGPPIGNTDQRFTHIQFIGRVQ